MTDEVIVVIKFSDRIVQIGWMKEKSSNLKATLPLYIEFSDDSGISFLEENAFKEAKGLSFPLMFDAGRMLSDYLWDIRSDDYKQPAGHQLFSFLTPDLVWCAAMIHIIDRCFQLLQSHECTSTNFLITYPDNISSESRDEIFNAVYYCRDLLNREIVNFKEEKEKFKDFELYKRFKGYAKNNKFKFKIVPNSRGACETITYLDFRGFQRKIISAVSEMYKTQLVGIFDYGFNFSEFYLILVRDKTAIVVGKKRVNTGLSKVYQRLLKIIEGREDDKNLVFPPFEKLDTFYKGKYNDNITSFRNLNTSGVHSQNFKSSLEKDIPIEKEEIKDTIKEETNLMYNAIRETIRATKRDFKEIKLDGHTLKLDESLPIKCLINCEEKDVFLIDMLKENNNNITFRELNSIQTTIFDGCSCYSRSLFSRMTDHKENRTPIFDDYTVCELIQPHQLYLRPLDGGIDIYFPEEAIPSTEMLSIGNTQLRKYITYEVHEKRRLEYPDERMDQDFYIGEFTLSRNDGFVYLQLNKYFGNLVPRVEDGCIGEQDEDLNSDIVFIEKYIDDGKERITQYSKECVLTEKPKSFGIYPLKVLQRFEEAKKEVANVTAQKTIFQTRKSALDKKRDILNDNQKEKFPTMSDMNDKTKDLNYVALGDSNILQEKYDEYLKPYEEEMANLEKINV